MNKKSHLLILLILGLILVSAFTIVAILVNQEKTVSFDDPIMSAVYQWESPMMTLLMEFISFVGSAPVVIMLLLTAMFIFYFVLRERAAAIILFVVVAGSHTLNQLLKSVFERARPDLHRLVDEGGYSFPSGHAMAAVSLYATLTILLWQHIPTRFGKIALLIFSTTMILLMGLSRIYLGVHYPSDVAGGYIASASWLVMTIFVYRIFQKK